MNQTIRTLLILCLFIMGCGESFKKMGTSLNLSTNSQEAKDEQLSVTTNKDGKMCTHEQKQYKIGESFSDNCNSCVCGKSGINCTKIGCQERKPTCNYQNKQYKAGENFTPKDGCNSCSCNDDGIVLCTKKACNRRKSSCNYENKKYEIGEFFTAKDGCNKCSCQEDGVALCTIISC